MSSKKKSISGGEKWNPVPASTDLTKREVIKVKVRRRDKSRQHAVEYRGVVGVVYIHDSVIFFGEEE